jgi:hypothetical protein
MPLLISGYKRISIGFVFLHFPIRLSKAAIEAGVALEGFPR